MAKANEDRCTALRRTHTNDLAPWVAEITRDPSETGHTALTVKSYERLARDLAHWMVQTKVGVGDIDESVIHRFVQHRCCCFGNRHETRLRQVCEARAPVRRIPQRAPDRATKGDKCSPGT